MNQFVDDRAKAPPIDCLPMTDFVDDFGGQVFWSSTDGKGFEISLDVVSGQSKVSEFDIAVGSDQYVFRFETEDTSRVTLDK